MGRKRGEARSTREKGLPVRRDPLARWMSFMHRGTTISFVPSGITVVASTPEELVAETETEILTMTDLKSEN